jgi:hypothetical protein
MNKWLKFGMIGLLALGALAVAVSGVAYAQSEQPADPSLGADLGPGRWGRGGRGLGDGVALQAAADALGMTPEELSTQLWGGKTLADLAEEKGVALEDVRAAVQAAHEAAFRDSIAQAVENGRITQENADWLLEGLDKGFLGGFGGRLPGFGRGGGLELQPETPPAASSTDS